MPLNTNAALLQLAPPSLQPLDLGSKKQASMERERLQLMREQFEEAKRQNEQDNEYRRMHEAGEMTRARMQSEREAAQQKALADAELLKQKRAAHAAMYEYEDASDFEGMNNAANVLNELGGRAIMTGQDENGFPIWQVDLDREAVEKQEAELEAQAAPRGPNESAVESLDRLSALGFPTNERGPVTPRAGIGSSEDMTDEQLARVTGGGQDARAATDEAFAAEQQPLEAERDIGPPAPGEDTDQNVLRPEFRGTLQQLDPMGSLRPKTLAPAKVEAPDLMGSVPTNVIDTGAMAAQTKQRLGPVMASIEAGMPQAYRDSTRHNNEAATSAGLPADKAIDLSLKLRSPAEGALQSELAAGRTKEKDEAKLAADLALDPIERQKLIKSGRDAATLSYTKNRIDDKISTLEAVKTVNGLLDDEHPENDDYAINFLMKLAEQKGSQSDKDAMRMDGISASSTPEQVKAWLHRHIEGGTYEPLKKAMKAFAQRQHDQYQGDVFSWIDSTHEEADGADHPLEGKGRDEVVRSLPDWVQKEYNDARDKEEGAEPMGARTSGAASGGGINPADAGELHIPEESRIAFAHNNPGNLMFDKDNPAGAEVGEPKEGGGNWARFSSPEAGLEALRQYIERHGDMTIRAFLSKYAPASDGNDTEKYIADAARELKTDPDATVYETDTYDMMRFIARHESSTELPYQYDKVDEKNEKLDGNAPLDLANYAGAPPPAEADDTEDEPPAADPAERVRQLLRKAQR